MERPGLHEDWKLDTVLDLYDTMEITGCIVFANTRERVDWLQTKLVGAQCSAVSIHSGMPQELRMGSLRKFRLREASVLITTDVCSRGIDMPHCVLSISYDMPRSRETYLHRVGRAGRYGRKAISLLLVKRDEVPIMRDMEQFFSTDITEAPLEIVGA